MSNGGFIDYWLVIGGIMTIKNPSRCCSGDGFWCALCLGSIQGMQPRPAPTPRRERRHHPVLKGTVLSIPCQYGEPPPGASRDRPPPGRSCRCWSRSCTITAHWPPDRRGSMHFCSVTAEIAPGPGRRPRHAPPRRCAPRSGSPRGQRPARAASFVRADAQPAAIDRRHRERQQLELGRSMPGLASTFMRSRAGMRWYSGILDQVQEAVVDVVHPHDGGGRARRLQMGGIQRARRPPPRRRARARRCGRRWRWQRHGPDLRLGQARGALGC